MDLITDMLMLSATFGAAIYCLVLATRLRRFTTLETGMGGAIAVLSAQVDEMTRALENARGVAGSAERNLEELTAKADAMGRRLELLMASLHDLPDPPDSGRHDEDEESRRLRFVRRRAARTTEDAE